MVRIRNRKVVAEGELTHGYNGGYISIRITYVQSRFVQYLLQETKPGISVL